MYLYDKSILLCLKVSLLFSNFTPTGDDSGLFANLGMLMDSGKARVRRQKIWNVVRFDRFQINNLLDDKYEPRERHLIVRDACRMVGREVPYCVATRNCEHFVTWLRYGTPESRQVGVLWLVCPSLQKSLK